MYIEENLIGLPEILPSADAIMPFHALALVEWQRVVSPEQVLSYDSMLFIDYWQMYGHVSYTVHVLNSFVPQVTVTSGSRFVFYRLLFLCIE